MASIEIVVGKIFINYSCVEKHPQRMTTEISTEISIIFLNNGQSTQALYSSLLGNRIWCKVTMPILCELTLGQEYCWCDNEVDKKVPHLKPLLIIHDSLIN
ncbi:4294_t:CDS:2 [Diversispora eburnea]|uniref:4294_t:CDS:1 n=1 Tax=Diversispora eburnea TaxID=1213867 RepID=A0A9N8WNU0_9GLOM|nr:4294_t:CDS:2 [Diversispora eburnea]